MYKINDLCTMDKKIEKGFSPKLGRPERCLSTPASPLRLGIPGGWRGRPRPHLSQQVIDVLSVVLRGLPLFWVAKAALLKADTVLPVGPGDVKMPRHDDLGILKPRVPILRPLGTTPEFKMRNTGDIHQVLTQGPVVNLISHPVSVYVSVALSSLPPRAGSPEPEERQARRGDLRGPWGDFSCWPPRASARFP